ncbi:MAG: hypothetical protein WA160_06305 [Pseudobdellovibrio sp.]
MIKSFSKLILILFSFSLLMIVEYSSAQTALPIRGWKYVPQNEESWAKIQKQIKEKNYSEVLDRTQKIIKKNNSTALQKAEAIISEALVLKELGYPSLVMEILFGLIKDYPGTQVSYLALDQLNELLPANVFNQEEFQNLFNRGSFKEVPDNTVSMVAYFIALDNMKKNLVNWINEPLSQIEPKSFWHYQLQYYKAVLFVKEKKLKEAEELFELLQQNEQTPEPIRQKATLQRARLLVSRFEFDDAEKLYAKNIFSGRVMGRVQFENAFVRYRNKDYSTALGMLKSLKAPYFETAINPNQYIMSMMIYRDLCYYQAVKKIALEFDAKFGKLIMHLKEGKDPSESIILMRMALQNGHLKQYADLVDTIRKESDRIAADGAISKNLKKEFSLMLSKNEARLQDYLRIPIQKKLNELANEMIEVSEKIKLLDYISGLDQFRLKSNYESRDYKAEAADNFSFEKLYWPVTSEYWHDEFSNYKVILTDRCEQDTIKSRTRK